MVASSEPNLILAMEILTKPKRGYFYILIRAIQTKQILMGKNIFAWLFIVHNTISLSCHGQAFLIRLHFERYFSHHQTKWWEEYLLKRSLIEHTCSWRDTLIVLQTNTTKKVWFFSYIVNITKNLKKTDERKCYFKHI